MRAIPEKIKLVSRELRKNLTNSEKILWEKLRAKRFFGIKFQKQFCLYLYTQDSGLDRYIIPDFYCSNYRLIIELDGSVHNRKDIYELDKAKEQILDELGYNILRFQNEEVENNIENVLQVITNFIKTQNK